MSAIDIELFCSDLSASLAFYSALGFEVVWRNDSMGYAVISRVEATTRGLGVEVVIPVSDLDAIYENAQAHDATVSTLHERPWGLRDFRVADPDGFYLRFTEPHDVTSPDYLGRK